MNLGKDLPFEGEGCARTQGVMLTVPMPKGRATESAQVGTPEAPNMNLAGTALATG